MYNIYSAEKKQKEIELQRQKENKINKYNTRKKGEFPI